MRFGPQRGFVDHVLAIIACVTASYAIAYAINKTDLAVFMAVTVGLSCLVGYGLSTALAESKAINADAWMFTLGAFLAVGITRSVNDSLPEGGFPWQLSAGVMLWMIMVGGGIFAWRDGTLLFLSLPGIALFGLVGVIDVGFTGLVLFCLFLISVAVLYARVHQRTMLEKAAQSGADTRLLWRDAWKWMAGPEWAFAAAGSIILLSFIGAPLVQFSLSGVSGQVSSSVQSSITRGIQNRQPARQTADQRIGRGPNQLDDTPLFEIQTDRPRLLRNQIFNSYTGAGWNQSDSQWAQFVTSTKNGRTRSEEEYIRLAKEYEGTEEITVKLRNLDTKTNVIFAPGIAVETPSLGQLVRRDGVVAYGISGQKVREMSLKCVVAELDALPDPIPSVEPIQQSLQNVPARVIQFANQVVNGNLTDFEKAQAIKEAIGTSCRYNLRAAATPAGKDPVDNFLFESKEGYCDLFASSMALMARSVGLPSRYVTGYLMDPADQDSGFTTIRNRDYHAWCEIYFPEKGWVPFDATELAEEVPGGEVGATTTPWQTFLSNLDWSIVSSIGMALLVSAAAAFWWFALRKPAVDVKAGPRGDVVRIQNSFQRGLESYLRHPRRFSQTIREFIAQAEPKLGNLAEPATNLAHQFESGMFGPTELSKDELKQLKAQTRQFLADLKQLRRIQA